MCLPPAQGEINPGQIKVHISAQASLLCDGVPRPCCAVLWQEIHESMLFQSENFFARGFLGPGQEVLTSMSA